MLLKPPVRAALALSFRLPPIQRARLSGRLATPPSNSSVSCISCRGYGSRSSSSETGGRHARNRWVLVFPAICFGLGTWQVYRRRWKLDLIASLKRRTDQPAVVVPPGESIAGLLLPRLPELEYRAVTLTGQFDHAAETLIGPRHFIDPSAAGDDAGGGGGLFSSGAGVGYHVVTPLQLATGERVLVNRGWVPARFADPASRPQGQIAGPVTLTGLVRLTEPAGVGQLAGGSTTTTVGRRGGGASNARITCRLRRDVETLSRELGTLPVFLDATADASDAASAGWPVGGQTRLSVRNEHMSYIFTWYSLGAMLTLLWAMKIR